MISAVVFAVSNRGFVELRLWPFPDSCTVPVFLLAFGAFAVGFCAAGLIFWIGASKARRRFKISERIARDRKNEIDGLKRVIEQTETGKNENLGSHTLVRRY